MKKIIYLILIFFTVITLISCKNTNSDKINISVTILPEAAFVNAVAKDLATITTVIPANAEPESYEPTAAQMISLANADIFFAIGLPLENDTIINNLNENTQTIDLAAKTSAIYPDLLLDNGRDPHIWLSPNRVIVMINEIKNALIEFDSENSEFYTLNAESYISELTNAKLSIDEIINTANIESFICYHPAFQYFAVDFNLTMYALEKEGEEASAEDLANLIDIAKEKEIKTIFYQVEQDSSQALAFAEEIDGIAIMLNPLSFDYISNLIAIANAFAG